MGINPRPAADIAPTGAWRMVTSMETKTTRAFEAAYAKLNAGQKQAVDTLEGPVMVLAGPGTGKTQTLTVRIGNILQKTQLDPWNILCLTFTESAAAEMRERLAGLIGASAYHVHISTFHSFCNSVLQDHPEIFAIASDWKPLSDVERVKLIQDALDSLSGTSPLKPFGAPYLYLKDVVGHIQALKQEDISPNNFSKILKTIHVFVADVQRPLEQFVGKKTPDRTDADCDEILTLLQAAAEKHTMPDVFLSQLDEVRETFGSMQAGAENKREAGKARTKCKNDLKRLIGALEKNLPRWRELAKVYAWYEKALHEGGRYDFEDMIIRVVQEFKTNKDLLADYQEQFQYILVDEFQDTNGAQNEVVELLGSADTQPNIFVVGDDKQSIYRFQGASLANMLAFYERYQDHTQVISLSENYRSQESILRASTHIIENSQQSLTHIIPGLAADLVPKAGAPATNIQHVIVESPGQEVALLAREIQVLLENNVSPGEIAVLVRYNRDAADIAPALRQHGVKAALAAGENALSQPSVQQWLAIWRYVAQPHAYDYLLADIIRYDWWDIDELDALKAVHAGGAGRRPLTYVFADEAVLEKAGVQNPRAIAQCLRQLALWQQRAAATTVSNLITTMLDESGWLAGVQVNTTGLLALEHMSTVLEQAKEAASGNHTYTLQNFIELLDLHIRHEVALTTPERRLGADTITVMTAHKSKGKEFDYVFIPRFIDGTWGGGRSPGRLPLPEGLVRGDVLADGEAEEDERRLLYVSLTRARKQVVLTHSRVNGSEKINAPSQFLHELPEDVMTTREEGETEQDTTIRLMQAELVAPAKPVGDIRSWVARLLDGYVMSVTHLNHYLEDPQLFYARHILRVPSVRTSHQAMGTAAHNALQDFFQAFVTEGALPGKQLLLTRFQHHAEREALSKQEYEDVLAVGTQQLDAYYDYYQNDFQQNTLGEYDFRPHNVRVDGVPITGKIDKIELLEQKQVNVVDYKTGSPERGLTKLKPGKDYHRQIVFYQLLCENSPQFEYEMVSGEVDFIRPNKKGEFVKKKIEVTDKDKQQLTADIKRVWQEIQELKFLVSHNAVAEKVQN